MSETEADRTPKPGEFSRTGRRLQRRRLTPDEQLAIVRRVEAGESMAAIAREIGYTRQRISSLYKKYLERGDEGMAPRKRGPKGEKLTDEQQKKLVRMLTKQKPSDFGYQKNLKWTLEKSMAASAKVIDRPAGKRDMRAIFKLAKMPVVYDVDPDEDLYTDEFKAWLDSPLANEIREREKAYHQRLEAEGHAGRMKRGRPTKAEAEARKVEPWKLDYREASPAPKPGGGDEQSAEGLEGDTADDELPDWNNMSEEEFEKMQGQLGAGRRPKPGPGVRVGKHRKAGGNQTAKKLKKKKKGGRR
jgi:transposase-like protein